MALAKVPARISAASHTDISLFTLRQHRHTPQQRAGAWRNAISTKHNTRGGMAALKISALRRAGIEKLSLLPHHTRSIVSARVSRRYNRRTCTPRQPREERHQENMLIAYTPRHCLRALSMTCASINNQQRNWHALAAHLPRACARRNRAAAASARRIAAARAAWRK